MIRWHLYRRSDGPPLGRVWSRWISVGPELELPSRSSLLVVGPTQVGKTSGIVVPALLRWSGPVVVTSVKRDVLDVTGRWRSSQGRVVVLDPSSDEGLTWDPLEGVSTLRQALALARDLVITSRERSSSESDFWNSLAVKVLAAVMVATLQRGGSIFDVVATIEQRDFFALRSTELNSDVDRILSSAERMEPRTLDSVCSTIDAMLLPWQIRQPLARVTTLLDGNNTLYLCAPRTDHRHYEGLFRGVVRTLLDEQQRRAHGEAPPRLLVLLDEAASIAPLDDLDQLAATVSGMNVTLLTVFQDFAQIRTRWGERAATIVNNHTTRVVMAGLVDASLAEFLPPALRPSAESPHEASEEIRQLPKNVGVLISGQFPRTLVRFRPWFRQRLLRTRSGAPDVTTMQGWSTTTPPNLAGPPIPAPSLTAFATRTPFTSPPADTGSSLDTPMHWPSCDTKGPPRTP